MYKYFLNNHYLFQPNRADQVVSVKHLLLKFTLGIFVFICVFLICLNESMKFVENGGKHKH
jgi:hypothetical protein